MTLGVPDFVPVLTRDPLHQTDSLPKYLVLPGSLVECVKQDDLRIKLIDLGEGSLRWSQSGHPVLSSCSHSLLQC